MAITQNTTPGADPVDLLSTNTHSLLFPTSIAELPLAVHRFHRLTGEIHNVGEPGGMMLACRIEVRNISSEQAVMDLINYYRRQQGRLFGEITVGSTEHQPSTFVGFRYERCFVEGITAKHLLQGWLMWRDTGPAEET